MNHNVLIIDDEPDILQLLSITLSRMGLTTYCAENISQAERALVENTFQLCLTDLKLPDGSGLNIVDTIQKSHPQTPVIVITAHGSMDSAITAMKKGAFDFINKPVDIKHLRNLIHNALSVYTEELNESISEIIGNSQKTIQLKQQISKVSRSQAPVLITGESGSGKELTAKSIHNHSSRREKPFIAVNCGAIPKELMESEFFGHLKGSFTGAVQDKQGLFQAAHEGTLFLDEIAELPLDMQVKLLRAIQEKHIRPVGAHEEIPIDVRIISATHQNLASAVDNKAFRSDLFYRINVIEIIVPALRERLDDIPIIAEKILVKIAKANNQPPLTLNNHVMNALRSYHFPGNIRELENILERASALSEKSIVDIDTLGLTDKPEQPNKQIINQEPPIEIDELNEKPNTTNSLQRYNASQESLDQYLDNIERQLVIEALDKHRWNRTATAKYLGVSFRSLRYRLQKLNIDVDK